MRTSSMIAIIVAFAMQLTGCAPPEGTDETMTVDALITGGLIYDGSGGTPVSADLGISAGKIAFIGDAAAAGVVSADTIDATGHWVTPGFIDAHSHAVLDEGYGKDARPYLHQGITTVVLGVDGGGR